MPRALALDLLDLVLHQHRPLDEAFAGHPRLAALEPRDRAFARTLAATTLRRLGQIDDLAGRCLDRPLPRRAARARDLLRLGVAQLLFLDLPAHAAVHATVALATGGDLAPYRGLVNGVLRRLDREGRDWPAAQDAPRLNTPDWLWDSWVGAYGEATARQIAAAHLAEPPLDLTVKDDPQGWAQRLGARVLPTGSLRLEVKGPIDALPGFAEGAWWVQDAAAALPARLLGDVAGREVIDLCAAPGGKTAQLAAAGARVTAVDRADKRLARLAANLDRLGLAARTVAADAARWRPDAPADAVLLDAPCSATGTLRRHPDVARLKSAAEVDKLAGVQARLLDAAAAMVRPGGVLVYGTCSLQPQEGPGRVEAFLAGHPDFARRPVAADEVPGLAAAVTRAGDLRTLPGHWAGDGGLDGFYAARLVRA
ncbi:MAG: RsmB/NOP family class I SAM-dependent RNA methyltransferase [Hyphomicrobiales bacterium]|nr:RsmB/NOP family class I SAM-dependent RNA methyltransferase [Hyphomicrobiales bacterium]MCP5372074.1 RsmB/NOP family class I SAM-dependent RNA methyltransferase [Hyphomicrobiales bacterium]